MYVAEPVQIDINEWEVEVVNYPESRSVSTSIFTNKESAWDFFAEEKARIDKYYEELQDGM